MIFDFEAVDAQGKTVRGAVEGDTPKAARAMLRARDLHVMQIREATANPARFSHWFVQSVSTSDLTLFLRQLASLVQAAMPIVEALETISVNSDKRSFTRLVNEIRISVVEGQPLADAFRTSRKSFPAYVTATIEAGERSGALGEVLERLADEVENQDQFQRKIRTALVYPTLITTVAMLVVASLLVFVVPQIVEMFDSLDQALPPLTLAVMAVSDFTRDYGQLVSITLAIFAIIFKIWLKQDRFRSLVQRFWVRLPVIGRIIRTSNATRFARVFALLHESGTPVLEALKNSAEVVGFLPMRAAIERARLKVREGSSLYNALTNEAALPPMILYMLGSGEASGQLGPLLNKAADNQEHQLDNLTRKILAVFEPLMVLLMGTLVLLIVLAILLPIFEMNQMVI